jgi:hypothetical protein
MAKPQAVTQVNPDVASKTQDGDADPVDRRGRPMHSDRENGNGPNDLPG